MFWTLGITAIVCAAIFSRIDDWGRDFTTNVARTGESEKIKPLRLPGTLDEAKSTIHRAVDSMSHWQWHQGSSDPSQVTIDLVRTTTLFRFKDDVQVLIRAADDGEGVIVNAVSRSRVGKGDLGQNPRNIKELFAKISSI